MSKDIAIGYWASKPGEGHWPVSNTPRPDQLEIVEKLKAAMMTGSWVSYRGWSNCRLCGKMNGSKELEIMSDGTRYRIPQGYLHYLEDHQVGYEPILLDALNADLNSEVRNG